MLLAHRLWAVVGDSERAGLDHWQIAHAQAMAELEPEFDAQWRGFDSSEQKTMRAVIAGEGSPYRAAVLQRLELTKDRVRKALPRLLAIGEIERLDEKYTVVDPLLAEWVANVNEGAIDEQDDD
jgi:hypothetical protein